MTDLINHPPHYTSGPAVCAQCGCPIECIDVTSHMGFSLGNVVKYVWRADLKGAALEDLQKAAWYLQHEIERRHKAAQVPL
ncbi:DUF3310 domain-containing protein [Falsirhodobacter sp. 20TX0035]|uniref:DUF3310 domain-containing protein n=1 Tax=Falsirhodobacter sp. 20TX0035 TaxID=3022019 RepID=UPI00232BBFA8|nr:DUF3310 domain-containing protein [Falsirhodobacter sp. 20TX0035]MDB6454990.1 DUF3310 domain-containing protein [Falsirhodobacter sp. 20TX0035]